MQRQARPAQGFKMAYQPLQADAGSQPGMLTSSRVVCNDLGEQGGCHVDSGNGKVACKADENTGLIEHAACAVVQQLTGRLTHKPGRGLLTATGLLANLDDEVCNCGSAARLLKRRGNTKGTSNHEVHILWAGRDGRRRRQAGKLHHKAGQPGGPSSWGRGTCLSRDIPGSRRRAPSATLGEAQAQASMPAHPADRAAGLLRRHAAGQQHDGHHNGCARKNVQHLCGSGSREGSKFQVGRAYA